MGFKFISYETSNCCKTVSSGWGAVFFLRVRPISSHAPTCDLNQCRLSRGVVVTVSQCLEQLLKLNCCLCCGLRSCDLNVTKDYISRTVTDTREMKHEMKHQIRITLAASCKENCTTQLNVRVFIVLCLYHSLLLCVSLFGLSIRQ